MSETSGEGSREAARLYAEETTRACLAWLHQRGHTRELMERIDENKRAMCRALGEPDGADLGGIDVGIAAMVVSTMYCSIQLREFLEAREQMLEQYRREAEAMPDEASRRWWRTITREYERMTLIDAVPR